MKLVTLILAVCALAGMSACKKKHSHDHDHAHHGHHHHEPPHGGTPVVLGDEAYNLELVRDAAAGSLTVYVLDGHLDQYIRIPAPTLELSIRLGDRTETLQLAALPNMLSGETVGDTSAFVGQADWLKTTGEFGVTIPSITVRGQTFTNVSFDFPKGIPGHGHPDHDHKH